MVQLCPDDVRTREVLTWQGVHLIHFRNSTCSQKVRIFLNLKGIQWHSHPLNLLRQENYQPWFLGINPRGLVPVLIHDGQIHIESNDILTHIEACFTTPVLIPPEHAAVIRTGLAAEDRLHLDIRALTMRFLTPKSVALKRPDLLRRYAQHTGTIAGAPDPHKAVEVEFWRNFAARGITDDQVCCAVENFREAYTEFDRQLQSGEFLCGNKVSVLDIAWFIYTHRLTAAGYPFAELHPQVHHWYRGLLAQAAFAREVSLPGAVGLALSVFQLGQKLRGRSLAHLAGFG